ncbi:MAG TPA: VWA domain-containing protein, partial [Solirubrobacteraceae bacterium]|nr:VWA domain-containing protein [Solirubrobacteraceae bacterium]
MRLGEPQSTADQAIMAAAVGLGRALREFGLSASVDAEHTFLRALAEIDVRDRTQVFWAGYAAFVHAPTELPIFEAVFERFWEGRPLILQEAGSEHGESDARMQGSHHGGEALPQYGGEAREAVPLDGDRQRGKQDIPTAEGEQGTSNQERGILAAWSSEEILSTRENLEYQQDELLALRLLAQEIKRQAPSRRSRRARPSPDGHRFDVRGTVRESLATDGEAFRLAFNAPTLRPRRLLFLCDVSGSMERYSRVLLASLKAAVGAARRAEAFVFATRLTRLTKTLDGRDLEQALETARAAIPDWSGGTRIGQALSDFNATYGRRGFARGAIVLVVSDGWDRGDPRMLEDEVRRLQLQSRRLVWINPRPMSVDQQPLAIGMRAAMPYIDDFVPGHDPRAVAGLAQLIGGLA